MTTPVERRAMIQRTCNLIVVGACFIVAMGTIGGASRLEGAGIGLNFGANLNANTPVGSQTAGVVPLGNWNDVSVAQQTNLSLNDSAGVPSGLTLTTGETFTFPATAYTAGGVAFANAGDTSMMIGHIYHGGGVPLNLTFTGAIPYSNYDVYIYYNSGGVTNTQTFSILDSSGGSLGLSRTGFETPGGDTTYIASDGVGGNEANYVLFSGLTSASVPTNFIIQASSNAYGYFNGIQIVQHPVPEPSSCMLLLAGATPALLWLRRRAKARG